MKMKRTIFFTILLVFISINSNASLLEDANKAFDDKKYKEALSLYEQVLEQQPENTNVIYWTSLAARQIGDNKKQVYYLEKLKDKDGRGMGIESRETLIQAYEKLGKLEKRDSEIKELVQLYDKNKDSAYKDRKFFARDLFEVDDYKVIGFEYFDLSGEFAKKYHFFGQNKKTQLPFTISLGSYKGVNEFEKELGNLADGQRLYHLDGYDGKKHYTYAFYKGEPDYNDVKKFAEKIFKEGDPQKMSISSSGFSGGVFP